MSLQYAEGWAIPFDAPFYPQLPAWYRGVQIQLVKFRADPDAVARFLPQPLTPASEGWCVASGMRMPFTTAYGPFLEAAVEEEAVFNGTTGWYTSIAWHDGPRGIAAGREIYGTPKIFSDLDVAFSDGTMTTRASVGGVPVVTISSTMEVSIPPGDLPALAPAWRLKIIPRADGPSPAIKQLIDVADCVLDLRVHAAYRGRGTVRFEPSPLGDLSALTPIEYGDAYYYEADFGEGFGRIVHDYLAAT